MNVNASFTRPLGVAGLNAAIDIELRCYMPKGVCHIDRQSNEFLAIFCQFDELVRHNTPPDGMEIRIVGARFRHMST